ncbi:MAG: hypothetical protein EHM13_09950, partial [Acidobacteria bacterium]
TPGPPDHRAARDAAPSYREVPGNVTRNQRVPLPHRPRRDRGGAHHVPVELAEGEQIVAAPTLVKRLPLPLRRLAGDLSNLERVLLGLDLRPRE